MSPSAEDAQAQWLEQLDAMRKAIADLNLPADAGKTPAYGDDLEFDDDDFSGTASGEDIWDIISDEYEEEYSSDHLDQFPDGPAGGNASGLDASALKEQITAILSCDSNDEELQMMLADVVGYGELDMVADLISHRKDIMRSLHEPTPAQGNDIVGRLQTRAEREEALRRADFEHKNAALAPAMDRTGPQYPMSTGPTKQEISSRRMARSTLYPRTRYITTTTSTRSTRFQQYL
ncbi:hypothetical protein HRS9139_10574 [Pyrenophora teres f. teres]|nr:hypothetical protein HRS9139_10574 [Pyrenophora teres f. teres]